MPIQTRLTRYHAAVTYLESLNRVPGTEYMQSRQRKLNRTIFLARLGFFLNQLGNPHRKLRYIHIGGTSGKGSVAIMLHSILTRAGIRNGLYTSPFTTTTAEKFRINGRLIPAATFADLVEELKPAIDHCYLHSKYGRPSYYEVCTALAILWFARSGCRFAILEVGLGGRYDATNIIPAADVTVINTVSFDHMNVLGNSLLGIAKEKAGIIKPGTTLITGQNDPAVVRLLHRTCKTVGADFVQVLPGGRYRLKLNGGQQQANATLAEAAAEQLGIAERHITTGLANAALPCRFEQMQSRPRVILDGAHNESKIQSVLDNLAGLTYNRLLLIIALTKERDPKKIIAPLSKRAAHVWSTRYTSNSRPSHTPLALAKALRRSASRATFHITLDPFLALDQALRLARPNDLILVVGSFYLTGELRTHWMSEERILLRRSS